MASTNDSNIQFLIDFVTGGTAGVIAKTVTAPLERVKLLIQTANSNQQLVKPYKGIIDCAVRCVKEEGFISLWRGNWVNVVRYFPTQALNFSFKDFYQRKFFSNKGLSRKAILTQNILAGGFAGCTTTLFVHPLDLTRTRLGVDLGRSVNERQFRGMNHAIVKIYTIDGIRGLYYGLPISMAGIFIYRGLYFGTYDTGKSLLMTEQMRSSFLMKFLYAQAVVMFSETISYPTDTVKRRLMMQAAGGKKEFNGTIDCVKKIIAKEGWVGLMKGNASNLVRGVGSSLVLVLYDELKQLTTKSQTFH